MADTPRSIFISHNTADKAFARRVSTDLAKHGVKVWIDEAEIQLGDSLIQKIQVGIHEMDYLGVVLSPNSVASLWVQRELEIALTDEIQGKRVKVLPLLYQPCEMPGFLRGKLYADFTSASRYMDSIKLLLRRLDIPSDYIDGIGRTEIIREALQELKQTTRFLWKNLASLSASNRTCEFEIKERTLEQVTDALHKLQMYSRFAWAQKFAYTLPSTKENVIVCTIKDVSDELLSEIAVVNKNHG